VLAFTDSDCIPENVWIEKGVKKITNIPNCGLVAGRIKVFPENTRKPSSAQLFDTITVFSQKKYVENIHFGATANLFTLKEVIENVGYFDATLKSGADLKWGQKVYNAGYKIVYSKEACIAHPARNSLKSLLKKHARVVGGLYDMHRGNYPLKEFLIDLKDDWPHYQDFKDIFHDKRLANGIQKFGVIGIMLLVKFTRVAERIKLRMGTKSKRI
jgi:hypothetical protein